MDLKSLYNSFHSHPEGSWIMRWDNAQRLYKFIKRQAVQVESGKVRSLYKILDLGTGIGCSASIVALAMKNKGITDYEIHTIEQFEKCFRLAQEFIPEELKQNIKFYHIAPMTWHSDYIPYQYFSVFRLLPDIKWDFIIMDGPGPFMEEGKFLELPNGDVMKMLLENKLKPGTLIAWDGRILALQLLERFFGNNFYLVQPGQGTDFNIIERKDNPVEFDDVRLKVMTEAGYFKT